MIKRPPTYCHQLINAFISKGRFLIQVALAVAVSALIVTTESGCSVESKKARILAQANRYFDAGDYSKAEIEYKNLLQLDSSNPEAVAHLSIIFFDQGRMGLTSAFLPKAQQLQPNNLEVRIRLAMYYAATGRIKEARENALFVLAKKPQDEEAPIILVETILQPKDFQDTLQRLKPLADANNAPALIALGMMDLIQKKPKDAEEKFLRAQALNPKSSAAYLALGSVYSSMNNLAKASQSFAKASELATDRSPRRLRYAQFSLQTGKVDLAKRNLAEITKKTPDFLPAWLMLADITATEKKYDESLAALNKVLTLDPVHHDAMLLNARVKFDKGDRAKVIPELERISRIFPKSPQVQLQLGITHLALGEANPAIASLNQALAISPNMSGATLLLAEIYIRQGKQGNAIASLTNLVKAHPELAQARLLLAQAYRAQGSLDEALEVYRQIEKSFSPNPQTSHFIGMILLQQRKRDAARQAFNKALEIDPNYLPAIEQQVNVDLIEKKLSVASQRVEGLIAKHPQSAELYLLMAKIHLAAGDSSKCEADLRRVVQLQPDSPTGYVLLARLFVSTDQKEMALANLQQAIAKNPKDLEALMLIAAIHEQKKDFIHARESYEKIVAINPKFVLALNNLAYLYSEQFNELEKAYNMAQQARKLVPNEPNIADTLGWVLYKRHEYPWALTLLSESAEKLSTSADVQFHLGMAHYMMGAAKPARAALERAISLNSAFQGIALAKQSLAVLEIDTSTNTSGAKSLLEKVLAEHPDDPIALSRLGSIYMQQHEWDKAGVAFEAVLKTNPNNIGAAMEMVRVHLARKDNAKALELAKATRKLAPDDPEVSHALGRLAFDSGDYAWAMSLQQESARKLPDNAEVLFDLAEASYSNGQVETAVSALNNSLKADPSPPLAAKAKDLLEMIELTNSPTLAIEASTKIDQKLSSDPNNIPVLMVKGTIQEQKKDLVGAKKTYEKALERYPEFTPAMRRLTIIGSTSETVDSKTIDLGNKARVAFPNDSQLAKALGILMFRQGNFSRAVNLLQESSRELSADSEVFYYIGLSQLNLKDRTKSIASLQHALELGLNPNLAVEARKVLAANVKK